MSLSPPVQIAAGLASGSVVHGALTGDWLLGLAAVAATAALAAVASLTREVLR